MPIDKIKRVATAAALRAVGPPAVPFAFDDSAGGFVAKNQSGVAQTIMSRGTASGYVHPQETGAVGTALAAYGNSTILASTSPTAKAYTVGVPVLGYVKRIASIGVTTSGTATVTCSAGVTFDGTNQIATFTSQGGLQLIGVSSTRWAVIGLTTGTVALSTA